VFHPYRLSFQNGRWTGLLDNFIGQLVCNSLLLSEPNLALLARQGKLGLFYGDSEEWSTITPLPALKKSDLVIVVDAACGKQYAGMDFGLENISGLTAREVKALKDSLAWEGFTPRVKRYDGTPEDEDEAWKWRALGHKIISFIIPIEGGSKGTGWHVDDCSITVEKVARCQHGLKRTLNYLSSYL